MRVPVVFVLLCGLYACSGPSAVPQTSSPATRGGASVIPAQVVDPLAGVSAHYVVETGENADGQLQVDVRQMQEPSIFASPMPFRSAIIVYPDNSTQRVDKNGMFDAAESSYAAKHGESIGDPNVTINITSLSAVAIAYQPTTFGIYVPSKKTEREESSVADSVKYTLSGNHSPDRCNASAPHQSVDPNDVAAFVFTSAEMLGVSFPVLLSSCTTKQALGRVNDYLWVLGSNEFRYTIRYQAPSRATLKANDVTRVGEYLNVVSSSAAATRLSPRYDVACGQVGC